jgi:hypothetical protein
MAMIDFTQSTFIWNKFREHHMIQLRKLFFVMLVLVTVCTINGMDSNCNSNKKETLQRPSRVNTDGKVRRLITQCLYGSSYTRPEPTYKPGFLERLMYGDSYKPKLTFTRGLPGWFWNSTAFALCVFWVAMLSVDSRNRRKH